MAEKRIEKNDIFEPGLLVDIINQTKELEKAVRGNIKAFSDLLKTNPFETVKDVKEYQAAVSGVVAGTQTLKTAQEENKKATDELNASLAKEVSVSKQVQEEIEDINGSLEQNIKLQTSRKTQISLLAKEQKVLNDQLKLGRVSVGKYNEETAKLSKKTQELKVANSQLSFTIKAQIKEGQAASTSFDQQAQRLGQLKSAYRKLSEEQRDNEKVGGSLLRSIKSLDKQVKANDASIGNFQRNVGNYNQQVEEAASSTDLFGISIGSITDQVKNFAANPLTAVTGGLTALTALYASSTSGAKDLRSATTRLSTTYSGFAEGLARFVGADGRGGGLLDSLVKQFKQVLTGIPDIEGDIAVNATNALDELRITVRESDRLAKEQLDTAEELRQVRDDEQRSLSERNEANVKLLEVINQREEQQLKVQKEVLRNKQLLLSLDENNVDLRLEVLDVEYEIADIQEENEGFRSEALTNNNSLLREELALTKKKEDQQKKIVREKPLEQIEQNAFLDQKNQNAKIEEDNQEHLDRITEQKRKQIATEQKLEKESTQKTKEEREKEIQDNINTANQLAEGLANALDQRSQKRIDKIQEEEAENDKALDRQERRAEQGLSNEVAFNEKKAAELEQQREEEQRKAERNAKILSYFNLLSEYAKENPNTAAGKALAQVAIAETVSGLFYEGTDRVGDDTNPNPFMKGKDNTIIGVTPEERIFGHKQSLGIRAMFGSITNDQLIEYAKMGYNNSTTTTATLNDVRIVQAVRGVEQAVKSNQQVIEIDTLNQIVDSRINEHGFKTKRVHKRTRL